MNLNNKQDIQYLITQIENLHVNPYKFVTKETLQKELELAIDQEGIDHFAIAIQKALTLMRDAHTNVPEVMEVVGNKLPLRLKQNDGKYYITGTNEANRDLLFQELIGINGFPLNTIIQKLEILSSKENSETLISDTERILRSMLLLDYFGFGIPKRITLQVTTGDYEIKDFTGQVSYQHPFDWSEKGFEFIGNEKYRFRKIGDTILFQYTLCSNSGHTPEELQEFQETLLNALADAKTLILDLRLNKGGSDELFEDFFKALPRHLKFYVAMSRTTFSAAMHHLLYLKRERGAVLIGENAGQRPNRFGYHSEVKLPNSKIIVFVATQFYELLPGQDIDVIEPDIKLPVTIKDYKNRNDPLEKLIAEKMLEISFRL